MALKIRLRQQGAKNSRKFRLVVTEARSSREGAYLEALGWYDPQAKEDMQLMIKQDRVNHWVGVGAQMTESAFSLVKQAAPEVIREYQERLFARARKRNEKKKAAKQRKA